MGERGDFIMPEGSDAVSVKAVRSVLMGLPGLFMCRQVILFPVLFTNTVSMRCAVLEFGGSLMVFVM